jgi:hypothetical protein
MRWIESLAKSNTIGEVSLALTSLLEYSKAFGACKEDPLEGVGPRPTTSIYGGHRIINKQLNKSTLNKFLSTDGYYQKLYLMLLKLFLLIVLLNFY